MAAVEAVGSRPPGLLVVGKCCGVLFDQQFGEDQQFGGPPGRVKEWVVEEGGAGGV